MYSARLRRLNADTSWLFEIPYRSPTDNQLVDPWLADTPQTDYFAQFSLQSRRWRSSLVESIGDLQQVLQVESNQDTSKKEDQVGNIQPPPASTIDAILISHPFTDHAHPDTLAANVSPSSAISSSLRMFTTARALDGVQAQLSSIPGLRTTADLEAIPTVGLEDAVTFESLPGHVMLPDGIKLIYLPACESTLWNGPAWPELHGGVAVVYRCLERTDQAVSPAYNVILYSPHGVAPSSLPPWLGRARQRTLIHSLDRQVMPYILGGPVALGFKPNGLQLCSSQAFAPQQYLATHDEHKQAHGLVSLLLRRFECSVEKAQEELRAANFDTQVRMLQVGEILCV